VPPASLTAPLSFPTRRSSDLPEGHPLTSMIALAHQERLHDVVRDLVRRRRFIAALRAFRRYYDEEVTAELLAAAAKWCTAPVPRSEEHTSELQSRENLVCRLL